ncbi:MAG: phosphatidate cytidylyltransferase [Sulfuritalea sp.]|nr:phosphatidate cytidylyltransferase [Sulfuritalea sp.]
MLQQRIITALLLLAILVPAMVHPNPLGFVAVTGVLIAAGAWEWARLNGLGQRWALASGLLCAASCFSLWFSDGLLRPMPLFWLVLGAFWVLLSGWLLVAGVPAWGKVPQGLRWLGGVLALCGAWMALVQARLVGVNFLFSLLALVWVADICAYVAGRLLGGRFITQKLAPSMSPGKTWEGVIGALLGVVGCSYLWRWVESTNGWPATSLYDHLYLVSPHFLWVSLVFLTTMSVVGDLMESLFKRSAGVKDSSGLLPGHGGVLDRVDALLPVLPLAMLLCTA